VHRSAIVALDRVRELRSLGGGEYRVILGDGTQVPMSQRYRDRLP
jgi:DNA-binding LytR/AlgR family response regulator